MEYVPRPKGDYRYHHDDMDRDNRPPSCYRCVYRGCSYWTCYRIHLRDYFNHLLTIDPILNKRK